jgi:hypothetical protein
MRSGLPVNLKTAVSAVVRLVALASAEKFREVPGSLLEQAASEQAASMGKIS